MVDRITGAARKARGSICWRPSCAGRKGEYRKELAEFLKKGYQRVKVDGKFYEIGEVPALDKKFTHDIDVVSTRIVVRSDIGTRLADSLEQALKLADGLAIAEMADAGAATGSKPTSSATTPSERLIFSESSPARSRASPSGGRAAAVLVQQPVRRLPRNAAASASSSISIQISSFRIRTRH